MIRIHYRPLANRRAYESVCLPVPPTMTRRTGSYAASFGLYAQAVEGPAPRPDPAIRGRTVRIPGKDIPAELAALQTAEPRSILDMVPRPDPLGDAVTRGGTRHVYADERGRLPAGHVPARTRPPTTREIPIAVDATLPAISAALERLRGELAAMGLAHQAARVQAIGLAVGAVTAELREAADDRDANAHHVIRGVLQ